MPPAILLIFKIWMPRILVGDGGGGGGEDFMGHASLVAVDSTAKMEHHMVHHYLRAAQTQTVIYMALGTHHLHSHQMSCI